jgi:hypothetical protein
MSLVMKRTLIMKRIWHSLLFIFIISLGSCYNHDCLTCKKYDFKTGKLIDEVTACDPAMISDLQSKGYGCR